jgi:hypothetical protein
MSSKGVPGKRELPHVFAMCVWEGKKIFLAASREEKGGENDEI